MGSGQDLLLRREGRLPGGLPSHMTDPADGAFEAVLNYPDPGAARSLSQLVGLDEIRDRVLKEALILLNPKRLETWSTNHYRKRIAMLESLQDRSPLIIFAGD